MFILKIHLKTLEHFKKLQNFQCIL